MANLTESYRNTWYRFSNLISWSVSSPLEADPQLTIVVLISGISTIDVDELKNATQYAECFYREGLPNRLHGWKNSDPEITWFWRALRSFSQEERAQFLMFVTSSSRVPLGGFSQLQGSSGIQPFQIHKASSLVTCTDNRSCTPRARFQGTA